MFPVSSAAQCPDRGVRQWPGNSAVQQPPHLLCVARRPGSSSLSHVGTSPASSAPPPPHSAGQSSRRNVNQSVNLCTGAGNVQEPHQPPHCHHHLHHTLVRPLVNPLVSQSLQEYLYQTVTQLVQHLVLSKPVMTTGPRYPHLYHHPMTSLRHLLSSTPPHLMMSTGLLSPLL